MITHHSVYEARTLVLTDFSCLTKNIKKHTIPSVSQLIFCVINSTPVLGTEITTEIAKDPVSRQVYHLTVNGWPEKVPEYFQPFFLRRSELSFDNKLMHPVRN